MTIHTCLRVLKRKRFLSSEKGGFQSAGGTILQIP